MNRYLYFLCRLFAIGISLFLYGLGAGAGGVISGFIRNVGLVIFYLLSSFNYSRVGTYLGTLSLVNSLLACCDRTRGDGFLALLSTYLERCLRNSTVGV